MRKTLMVVAVLGTIVATGGPARADEPVKLTGRVYLGIERMTGFAYTSSSGTGQSQTASAFGLNLFGASTLYSMTGVPITYGAAPRLAVDVNVLSFLTVGLAAYLAWGSLDGGGSTTERAHFFGFGFAPRVGVTVPIGDRFIFWGRAGATYERLGTDGPTQGTTGSITSYESALWVNLEPTVLVKLVEHVSLGATFVVDLPVAGVSGISLTETLPGGSTTTRSASSDFTAWNVGLQLGLTAWF